jgi:hypothetical protein
VVVTWLYVCLMMMMMIEGREERERNERNFGSNRDVS